MSITTLLPDEALVADFATENFDAHVFPSVRAHLCGKIIAVAAYLASEMLFALIFGVVIDHKLNQLTYALLEIIMFAL